MRRLFVVCALLVSACGDVESEGPKLPGTPPTLTVTIGDKVCLRELRGECCAGVEIFRVHARIEANVPIMDFRCRTTNSRGEKITCSGPPSDLLAPWEGVLVCETGDWNSDGSRLTSCGGSPNGDRDRGVSTESSSWDPLFELRKCDPERSD